MERHRSHAERNKGLSESLFQEGKYLDWSCITAFYSALHFVYCKVLPMEYNGIVCNTIDEAKIQLRAKNKHEATSDMVRVILPNISTEYNYLMNLSFTARYYNNDVDVHTAKLCQKFLSKIEKEIIKK